MILIICAWLCYFVICLSIGAGILKLIGTFTRNNLDLGYEVFYKFWFGFASVIGILQLISIFFPLKGIGFISLLSLAGIFMIANFRGVLRITEVFFRWSMTSRGLFSLLTILAILLLVSYSANKEVTHTDTFIYHYNAVKWAKEYPAVPGLVNLHNRLGFNSSFFLFAAFTEVGLYEGHSAHLALSFVIVACLIHWFLIISNPYAGDAKRIFCMMSFAFLVYHSNFAMDIASLSTDYPMAVLTLVFCVILLDRISHKAILLLPLSATIFAFKLSGMLTVVFSVLIFLGYMLTVRFGNQGMSKRNGESRALAMSFFLFCFIMGGFVVRNAIVSGWLIYPFPIGNLHLPWSTPKPYVDDMIAWIKSFPKIPGGTSPETIAENSFFFWFSKWFARFRETKECILLLTTILLLIWSALKAGKLSTFVYRYTNLITLLCFAAASLLLWFVSAPDIRFGEIYFYILFATAAVIVYQTSGLNRNLLKILAYAVFISELTAQIPGFYLDRPPALFTFAYTKQPKLQRVVASPPDETPALYIYMPRTGNQCGDSPLPCTPYAGGLLHSHQSIRQRTPGDLSKGFLPPNQTK